jgi:dTDP-4-amino-4,6-dideoxygalactose transaminase
MVDLIGQHQKIRRELDEAIANVIDNASFIQGESVKAFSASLANYLKVNYVIPCANGTDALQIALMALDLPKGAEVIVPSFNYVSAAEAIALLGFVPVFCDVDPFTFTIDPADAQRLITNKTSAIVPVHLFGQCADMNKIMALATTYNLYVIEDAAQALGSTYRFNGKEYMSGTIGHIGTTSFFPSKNLGCMGDGGAIYVNDDVLAKRISSLAGHGQVQKYKYDLIGVNSRLDSLQAAILSVKLKYLQENIADRQRAGEKYDQLFSSFENLITPVKQAGSTHTYNQYTVKTNPTFRVEIIERLKEKNIPFMIYYPSPLHLQSAYQHFVKPNQVLPIAERLCTEVLSFPIHPELEVDQQEYIAQTVSDLLAVV